MKPISILKKLKESTDWKALKAGLSSCNSADDLQDLMHSTMDGNDFGRYCDYVYEIESKSDLQWSKNELKKLANENIQKSSEDDKRDSNFKNTCEKYIKELDTYFKGLGGSTDKDDSIGIRYDLTSVYDSMVSSAKSKEKELLDLMSSYDGFKITDSYYTFTGYFNISLDTEDEDEEDIFDYNFNVFAPYIIDKYLDYKGLTAFKTNSRGVPVKDIDKIIPDVINKIKESFDKIIKSFDVNNYQQWLDKQIEVYNNKIQRRENRNKEKQNALSNDAGSVKLSKQNVIDILDKQSDLPSEMFDRNYGSLYVKGTLSNGYKTSVTIKLFGGNNPGEFDFGVADVTKNPDFVKHCIDELVSGLNAKEAPDRKEAGSGRTIHCYTTSIDNINKVSSIIKKLNSELTK